MSAESFFLGHVIDPASGEPSGENVGYDPADLTTHGVIVGMTGSGKTGLGVILLEEALLAGIPALILDPKGDMGNLALAFPDFEPASFEPWVNPEDAKRDGISVSELASRTAAMWKEGVSGWDPELAAIRRLREATNFTIYSPGSSAGVPVNIVGSLQAPDIDWEVDAETPRDEIEGFVSSLLTLAGIDADPISSPEHILLANLIEKSWREGRDLDIAALIGQVQDPPLRKLGVFELDAFFPPKDRRELAMRLNGLVASPSFAQWIEGPALDVQSMLYGAGNKPQAAIVYLAHLSEEERQFIVTLLLSKVVTWMRSQSGSSDLRALIYMDEVFGFVPPTANPPAKKPILTILKQARAYGVGLVLSTQNPVDLDYKAMSNAGTWMVGRLQTERDKARILEALESARGGSDMGAIDEMISGLDKRQFLLHNTREPEPQLFSTRWAMSYLRGPLTRDEVAALTEGSPEKEAARQVSPAAEPARPAPAEDETTVAPAVADGVPVYYLDPAASWAPEVGAVPNGARLVPALAARVHLIFDETKADIDHKEEWEAIFWPLEGVFDPATAVAVDYDTRDFRSEAPAEGNYVIPGAPLDKSTFFRSSAADLKDHLYRNRKVEVYRNQELKLYSRIGETLDDFEERCDRAATERADAEIAKVRESLEKKIDRARDALATAHRRMEELEVDADTRSRDEMLGGVTDVIGVLLGGRKSRSLSGASKRRGTARRAQQRLRTAEAKVADKVDEIAELEEDLVAEVEEIEDRWEDTAGEIDTLEIGLEKTDIDVDQIALVWVPSD